MNNYTIPAHKYDELCRLHRQIGLILEQSEVHKESGAPPIPADFADSVLRMFDERDQLPAALLYRWFPGNRNLVIAVLEDAGFTKIRRATGFWWIKPSSQDH